MHNISICGPEAVLALLVTQAKNFVTQGLDGVLQLGVDRDQVLLETIRHLEDAMREDTNWPDQRKGYGVLINFLKTLITDS